MSIRNFREAEQRLVDLIQAVKEDPAIKPPYKYIGKNDPVSLLLKFDTKEQKLSGEYGLYIPDPPDGDKPLIVIDPNGSDEERLNFTYFHEVSHHLLRSDNELYGFLDEIATQNDDLQTLKERFANIGAAEFLLPGKDVKELIDKKSFSIKLLLELDKMYPASKPAIAIQLARHATHKCIVVVCEYGSVPIKNEEQINLPEEYTGKTEKKHYHIRYSASSPSYKYSIGKYVVIPKNHLLRKIFEEKIEFNKGVDNIPFRSKKEWTVPCEGIFYKGKVYAVFNIEPPLPPCDLQPKLF
jgi:Zn-dependent peptidase ImmA (M78 family)